MLYDAREKTSSTYQDVVEVSELALAELKLMEVAGDAKQETYYIGR